MDGFRRPKPPDFYWCTPSNSRRFIARRRPNDRRSLSFRVETERRAAGEDVEVSTGVQDREIGPDGDGGDQAVDQFGTLSPLRRRASRSRVLVVDRVRRHQRGASEQPAQIAEVRLARARRAPPSGSGRRSLFPCPAPRRRGCAPSYRCRAGTRSTPRCRRGSSNPSRAQVVEVAVPPCTPHPACLVEREGLDGEGPDAKFTASRLVARW